LKLLVVIPLTTSNKDSMAKKFLFRITKLKKDKSLENLHHALATFTQMQAIPSMVTIHVNIANTLNRMGKLDEVIGYLQEAVNLMIQNNISRDAAGNTCTHLKNIIALWRIKAGVQSGVKKLMRSIKQAFVR
jgi:hypothetical protein